MKFAKVLAVFFVCFLIHANNSYASDIAFCGASNGYAYTSYRGMTLEKDAGWDKDGITNGKITLKQNDDGSFEILSVNIVTGGIHAPKDDGGRTFVTSLSEQSISLTVVYPGQLVETYIFQKLNDGKSNVMWTQAKAETIFPRVTAFVADCTYLNLENITHTEDKK